MTLSAQEQKLEMQKRCPINEMKFVNTKTKLSTGQAERKFNEDFKIVYSKSASSLPLSEFVVSEAKPCMDYYMATSYQNPKS
jgi:hypothetical protein